MWVFKLQWMDTFKRLERYGRIMKNCPILSKEIDNEDCENTIYATREETNDAMVIKRIKRVNGWKFICKNCIHNKSKIDIK